MKAATTSATVAAGGLLLTPAQATLVGLPTEGQFLVRGAAGAGKTTVALARAAHVAKQPLLHGSPRVLLLARSPALACELGSRLDALPAAVAARIEVDSPIRWCQLFLAAHGHASRPQDFVRPRELGLLIGIALDLVRRQVKRQVLRRPLAFFTTEIESMLLALGIERLDDYLPIEREGRTLPLDDESRRAVFAVFDELRALAARIGRVLPLTLVPEALRQLAATRTPPFDHVVVDDAHLLTPIELKLVRALSSGGSLTLFSALEQRFDPLAAKLTALRLERLDRTEVMPTAMRGPKAVYKVALQILRQRGRANSSDVKSIVPESIAGPPPRVIVAANWQGEFDALVEDLLKLKSEGRALRDAAVLVPSERELEFLAAALARVGLPARAVSDGDVSDDAVRERDAEAPPADDAIRLCTLSVAAGREFPLVYMLDVNRGAYPRTKHDLEDHERGQAVELAARALHLALTRATEAATLFASEGTVSPLLPKRLLERRNAPTVAP
ncbi:MAG: hypothetical protein EXS13_12820 [Planctomycetes bacterium]|nr:hypothetical protein [Planctomycetota bacterium]